MEAHGFRFSFTPLAGVLFTVPSRYSFAIGRCAYLALERGRPSFTPGCSCPALLRQAPLPRQRNRLRGSHALRRRFPVGFVSPLAPQRGQPVPQRRSLQPHDRNGWLLATVVVSAFPGSLATTTGVLSVPRGTEMFQFPRCPPLFAVSVVTDGLPHSDIVGSQPARGSPTLFAALPRPSSARSAEASSVCSCCLPCWNARRARQRTLAASPDGASLRRSSLRDVGQSALGKVRPPTYIGAQVLHP